MKKLFVPYELALLAKEKGFDEPCFAYYDPTITDEEILLLPVDHNLILFREVKLSNVKAPLYQQLIDFFREKHSINIVLMNSNKGWQYSLDGIGIDNFSWETNLTYYECYNKAIEEAFKLIQ